MSAAVVSNSSVGTINSWLPIQAGAFATGPTNRVALAGSGTFAIEPTSSVALAGSGAFAIEPASSVALAGSGTFAIEPTGSVALGGLGTFAIEPTGSVALGGLGTFAIEPTGSVALAGSGAFAIEPTSSVALAGSGTFAIEPTGSVALAGSGTFAIEPTGSVALAGGSLPNAVGGSAISSFGSVGTITRLFSETPDWTSAAHLSTIPLSSSEPIISQWELFDEYRELGEALGQMAELDEDDDLWIEAPALNIARNVAVELMTSAFPVPQIFNHGPKSLVFNWVYGRDNLYLTVSSVNVSILVSTPQKIKRRVEYPVGEFLKHEHTVPLLQLAYSEQQATMTVSGTSE